MGYSSYLGFLQNSGAVVRGVKFDLLLTIDFYDGPERGFACHKSGECLRFSVIAEAKVPTLRAFALDLLEGNRACLVQAVVDTLPRNSNFEFASDTDVMRITLQQSLAAAAEQSHYVAVGGAYLDGLAMMAISKEESDYFKAPGLNVDYYAIESQIRKLEGH